MRRFSLFLTVFICLSGIAGFAQYGTQFDNRGFENWANFGSGDDTYEPVHWHSGMSADGSYTGYLSKQIEPSTVVRPGSSGSKSARLWPRTITILFFSVTANGNMTNGRVYAGDMSATGSNNYNYTVRNLDAFNTPISVVPDSLTVWVCFRSDNSTQDAQVKAFVHGNADFKSRADGTVDPANMLVATATENFKRTSTSGGSYQWRRLSIPFVHEGPCNDPRYILLNITTNKNPGEGYDTDDLFIDDVLLVYNPSIQMEAIASSAYHPGDILNIQYTLNGTMSPENLNGAAHQVIAQLSDANGSFSNPTEMCRITTNTSGNFNVALPSDLIEGDHYRIRLVTTNYPMVSNDNGYDLTVVSSNADVAETEEEEEILGVEIYDLLGRRREEGELTSGIYIVRYQTKNGIVVKKIMKR
jgi:hypothetical protein